MDTARLPAIAREARVQIERMLTHAGSGHPGGSNSVIDILVALYFGRFVLKLHPVVLLGALCGGQTVAAALSAANEETESMTPVLGFTVTYAVSNVLLAVWGPVIVAFTS